MSRRHSGALPVTRDEILTVSQSGFISSVDNELDFVSCFPPELCEKLFTYLGPKDLLQCAQVSIAWRHITNCNLNWQRLCRLNGFINLGGETDPKKWDKVESHVDKVTKFRGKKTPKFVLPPVASTRIEPLCEWGRYFRQCRRLRMNWTQGRHIIQKLPTVPEMGLCTATDFNGQLAIFGSSTGCMFIWCVLGVPKLIHCIRPIRVHVEVEKARLTSNNYIVVLYQIGIIRIYKLELQLHEQKLIDISVNITTQVRIAGSPVNDMEYTLNVHDISDENFELIENAEADDDDVEEWIRELFRDVPWFEAFDYEVSNMLLATTEEYLIVSGLSCNCFIIWKLETGELLGIFRIGNNFHMRYKFTLTDDRIYVACRKANPVALETSYAVICHAVPDATLVEEIPSSSLIESIQVERGNSRMVWVTIEAIVTIRRIENGEDTRFHKPVQSYVDNLTLHDEYILYHEYDGFIVTLNWDGEELYKTASHVGIVRGIRCYKEFLVSAGDVRQLCVWNIHTGKQLYEIYHQPSRISHLFADETKIVTFGLEDPPVHIGFW